MKMEYLVFPWFVFWVAFSVIVGVFANQRRNRSGLGWFLLSILISPLLAGLLVAAMREADRPTTGIGKALLAACAFVGLVVLISNYTNYQPPSAPMSKMTPVPLPALNPHCKSYHASGICAEYD
jgi:hypothetical protein